MMKKILTFLVLSMAFGAFSWGQEPVDLVVILDTSSSMSSSYSEVADYLTGPFLREQLRLGDTFHLISFALTPALELSRRIEGRGDIQTIIGRLLILYPVNPDTDLISALEYGRRYVAGLPQGRTKKVFLISDGSHEVTEGPYAGTSPAEALARISGAPETYRALGADFRYIPVPLSASQTAQPPASRPPSGAPGSASPAPGVSGGAASCTSSGAVSGENPGSAAAPLPPVGSSGPDGRPETPGGLPADGNAQELVPLSQTPADIPQSGGDLPRTPDEISESGTGGIPAGSGVPQVLPAAAGSAFRIPLPLIIGIIAAAIVILALILLIMGGRLQRSPNRAMAQAASGNYREEDSQRTRENAALLASYAANQRKGGSPPSNRRPASNLSPNGPLMLSLFVADQNTAIGKRNIHTVKQGYTFSVGGGRSDFLIFLVPIPPHIADVRYDGNNCTFIPRKSQYFPDLGSSQLPNCIDQNIRVISDKKYELHIRVERYQDPLITLNRMLHSIELPGLPEF
ncbi:MAG: VWA domain-containing protein [Spirochaetaceae bacterium]|jgi:hypothetical protein|nr:VWA domain-containing protein [Spirochaetaceae bacterium]